MSSPLPGSQAHRLTRRTALAGLAVGTGALMTGCTTNDPPPGTRRRRRRRRQTVAEDPDVALAGLAVAGERFVLDALHATLDRHTDLATTLNPVVNAHLAHVSLLEDAAPDEPEASSSAPGASTAPDATGSPSPGRAGASDEPFTVPRRERVALRRLSALEEELSEQNKRHAFAAQSGAFARMLASMSASAAQHALVLGPASGGEGSP